MARLKNDRTGVVVNTSDETAQRMATGWTQESEKSGSTSKSSTSSRKSSSKSDDNK